MRRSESAEGIRLRSAELTIPKGQNMPDNRVRRAVPARYIFPKLKDDLVHIHATKSLRAIAEELSNLKVKITHRTVQRILNGDEPMRADIREQLGLPKLNLAPACLTCGIVHISRRCPKQRKQITRWRDLPTDQLKWAIENRKDYNP